MNAPDPVDLPYKLELQISNRELGNLLNALSYASQYSGKKCAGFDPVKVDELMHRIYQASKQSGH